MTLNYDYVRDILLFIEKNLNYEHFDKLPMNHKKIMHGKLLSDVAFDGYNKQELLYALELLIKEGYINCINTHFVNGNLLNASIVGLTWSGHNLLDNIRNDTVWNAVKQKATKVGGVSLSVLANSAGTLASALLSDPNAVQNFMQGIQNIKDIFS